MRPPRGKKYEQVVRPFPVETIRTSEPSARIV